MEKQITQFKGYSKSVREDGASYVQNFDIFADNNVLQPHYSQVDDSSAGYYHIRRMLVVNNNYLGLREDSGVPSVMTKTSIGADWTTTYTNSVGAGAFYDEMFIYYPATNAVYYYNGNSIRCYDFDTSTGTNTSLGSPRSRTDAYLHPNDGCIYFATDNKLHKISANGTISQDIAPTIPASVQITSIDSNGVYLVVACQSVTGLGSSTMYIVDTDLAVPNFVEVVDFGLGSLKLCSSLNGVAFGIVDTSQNVTSNGNVMAIRYWEGGDEAKTLLELDGTTVSFTPNKVTTNDKMYFGMNLYNSTRVSGYQSGIWCLGKNSAGNFVLSLDTVDSLRGTNDLLETFSILNGYRYFASSADTSHRTASSIILFNTGTYVTTKITSERLGRKIKLMEATLRTQPLPSGAVANLYYRVDEDSAWTQIIGESLDNNLVSKAEHDYAGDRFKGGYEYQFKLESTGGAVITGLYANFDEDND